MNNFPQSLVECTSTPEPHQVSAGEDDLFFLWNKPATSETRLFTYYDTVQVRTAMHSSKRQSATPMIHPTLSRDQIAPDYFDNGGASRASTQYTPQSHTNCASTLLCSGLVYELAVGCKVLVASDDTLPFIGEIISLFQNKKNGKMQFKVRWFWYKTDIDRENSKILRGLREIPFQNVDLSQRLDAKSLPHAEKIFSNGTPKEVFYSTATDINDLETILRPCYILFIDNQSGTSAENGACERNPLFAQDAFFCRYEYIVKEEKLVPISAAKSHDEAQRLAHTVAAMMNAISYWDLTDREAHARFNDNPQALVDLQLSIEYANAEEKKREEKRLRKLRYALVKSWLLMSCDDLRSYLVSVRSTAQQQQLLLSSSSPAYQVPGDPLQEHQHLEGATDDIEKLVQSASSPGKHDDDQSSLDWMKSSQTYDRDHMVVSSIADDMENGAAVPQKSQASEHSDFRNSRYTDSLAADVCGVSVDKPTLTLENEAWPLSPNNRDDSSHTQVASPYLKDKTEEKKNQSREGQDYQARIPSLASTALHLMLRQSAETEEEVLYWEDDEPKSSPQDGKVWSPVPNKTRVDDFLSKAVVIVEQLKADYWATFRMKSAQSSSESAGFGFGAMEATMRSEDLLSDTLRVDGSSVLVHGDLEGILLSILFACDYDEARALAALGEQIPQYFVFWSYAEHGRLVKYSERMKRRTVSNTYGKLKSTKSRSQIFEYYFRYLRSAVQLPVETSTRILSDSTVLTSRVIPAGYADNHIIDFEIDLLKYNMLADFLLRLRNSVDEVSYMEIVNCIVEFLQGWGTVSAMIIRMKIVLLRSYLRAAVHVASDLQPTTTTTTESPPYDSLQEIFSDFALFVPVFVSHDELQMYFFKRSSIHNFI